MRDYLLLIDDEWFKATLSDEDVIKIKDDMEGLSDEYYLVELNNGEKVETGIIDDIKECE